MNKYLVGAAVTLAPVAAFAQDVPSSVTPVLWMAGGIAAGLIGGWFGAKHMAKFVVDARNDNEQNWKDVVVALTDKLYASYPAPPAEVKK